MAARARGGTIDRFTLVGVLASTLAFATAYGVLLVLPLYLTEELGGTTAEYGVVASAATVTAIACIALLIRFPARVRPDLLLAGAALTYAAGAFGVAQLDSFGVAMTACGLVLGTSWAIGYTCAPMVVSALSDDASRGTYIGYATGMIQVGFGLGPLLAGAGRGLGLSFPTCFRAAGVLALVAGAVALSLRRRARTPAPAAAPSGAPPPAVPPGTFGAVLRSPAVAPLGIVFLCACLFTTMNGFQTTFAASRGLTYEVFYVGYTVAVIVARFGIAPRLRDAAATGVVAVTSTGVAASMALFLVVSDDLLYAVAAVALGITYGLTLPGVQAGAVNVSDPAVRARILPTAGLVFQTGILLFPLVAGTVITQDGYSAMLLMLVGIAVAIALFGGMRWIAARRPATGAADA